MTPTRQKGDQHWTRRAPDRILRGTAAPGAKLSNEDIADLYHDYDSGATRDELSRAYEVSRITIWRHLKARNTCYPVPRGTDKEH